jgi:NAD(P)H-hydrate epimerase
MDPTVEWRKPLVRRARIHATMEPITFAEVNVLDANSEYRGVPTNHLMEEAGKGVAEHIMDIDGAGKRILILCGAGNNGGDGFVAARFLMKHAEVEVVLLRSRERVRTELSRINLRHAEEVGVPISVIGEDIDAKISAADIIVDSMLGVGVSGALRSPYEEVVRAVNASGKRIVSVDIPTGWGSDLAVMPGSTVTFHAPKIGMGAECGQLVVKSIDIPDEAWQLAGPGELQLIPEASRDTHKGGRGSVLVIGGGPFTGAPALAAMAAHRCGIDLVYVAVPGAVADVVKGYSMDIIVEAVGTAATGKLGPQGMGEVLKWEDRCDAVVLGPGMGDDPDSLELAAQVYRRMAEKGKPVVVDADALKAFSEMGQVPRHSGAVLTPHAGEFRALAGSDLPSDSDMRVEAVRSLADMLGCVVLAKGPVDIVSDGTRVKLNDAGNSAMATGGTGDVLSGTVGALLAKGMEAFDAARTAAFVTGMAGDAGLEELGHSMLASDLLWNLPNVFGEYLPWWTRH